MKKKLLVVIMTGMILGLSACSSVPVDDNSSVTESVEKEQEDQAVSPEVTETPDSIEVVSPAPEAVPTMEPVEQSPESEAEVVPERKEEFLKVTKERHYDNCFNGVSIMYGHYDTLCLESTGYPKLTEAVNTYNALLSNETQAGLDKLEEWGLAEYNDYGAEEFRGPYVLENDMFLRRADSQILSAVENIYEYSGGAHGNQYFGSVNIDVATGEELNLEDIIPDFSLLPAILEKKLKEKYPDVEFWTDSLYDMLMEYVEPATEDYAPQFTWTLDYEGVTFYFSDYEISPYVYGTQQVTVGYTEYPEIFESRYFMTNTANNYVLQLPDSWRVSDVDLYGDGKMDYISVITNYAGEGDYCDSYDVTVNGNTFTQNTYCYSLDTYLVKHVGESGIKYYLYIQRTVESDYQSICVFEITDKSVEFMGEFSGGVNGFIQSEDFQLSKRLDLLSTYYALADCYVGEDGLPVEQDQGYEVVTDVVLTSTVDLTVDLIDEQGELLGSSYTFPAGTTYRFIATDGVSIIDVEMSDGQRGRFYVTPGWPATVNGFNAEECFEMLYFAG